MSILATDTYYYDTHALCAFIAFEWDDEQPKSTYTSRIENVVEYIPGQFYKRELPCILECLKQIDLSQIEAIVVDGHVFVDNTKAPGLGAHLYEALEKRIPIIGVAKTAFALNKQNTVEVLRGESKNPLHVSSTGIDLQKAAEFIRSMKGAYRIPTLFKELDKLSRSAS